MWEKVPDEDKILILGNASDSSVHSSPGTQHSPQDRAANQHSVRFDDTPSPSSDPVQNTQGLSMNHAAITSETESKAISILSAIRGPASSSTTSHAASPPSDRPPPGNNFRALSTSVDHTPSPNFHEQNGWKYGGGGQQQGEERDTDAANVTNASTSTPTRLRTLKKAHCPFGYSAIPIMVLGVSP